jgi:histone acetyltransferase (RNA polymerase elongator complex component)
MTNQQKPAPQQQLRNPYCKRAMRFTKEGYEALMEVKRRLEAKLERPISESVAIDMVLLGGSFI